MRGIADVFLIGHDKGKDKHPAATRPAGERRIETPRLQRIARRPRPAVTYCRAVRRLAREEHKG